MKEIVLSMSTLILTITFVILSSVGVCNSLSRLSQELDKIDNYAQLQEIEEKFKSIELMLTLTVNDNSLSQIEESYILFKEHLKSGDLKSADDERSRLICLVDQQRRLSMLNLKSVM